MSAHATEHSAPAILDEVQPVPLPRATSLSETRFGPTSEALDHQAAIDPYLSFRDAYYQYRRHLLEGGVRTAEKPPEKPSGLAP